MKTIKPATSATGLQQPGDAVPVFSRAWAMPNKDTFSIAPIRKLIERYLTAGVWVDPFCGSSPWKHRTITNDLNPTIQADCHLECLDFLKLIPRADGVLFDPPYSMRQVSEVYAGVGKRLFQQDCLAPYWRQRKEQIDRILSPGGLVICCGWNSGGLGIKRGYKLLEVLLVAHGGTRHDTIVTVERKA